MAEQGQFRSIKMWWHLSRMNSSSSWLYLFFQKSALVSCSCRGALSKPLGVKHTCDSCVPAVCRGSCARSRVTAGLQQDTLSAFHVPMGESAYLPASPALAYFLHTLLMLACGILSQKMCLWFFSKHINCSHLRCHLTHSALPLSPLTITLLHKPLECYSLTIISLTIEFYWHQLTLKGSIDPFHVLKFSSDPWQIAPGIN